MNVKVISETKNTIEIEIAEEDHTLGNYLRSMLLAEPKVKQAGYQIVHPLTGGIRVFVVTEDDANPRKVMDSAITKMEAQAMEFKSKFTKAQA
jgi:DNA-directed RNA polymerase subunit L